MRQDSNVLTEGKNKAMTEYSAQKKHPLKVLPYQRAIRKDLIPWKASVISSGHRWHWQIQGRIQN